MLSVVGFMAVHMSRDDNRILILCGDGQLLNSIAKAIFMQYPSWKLFFSHDIEECIAKFMQNVPNLVVAIPKEPIWDICMLVHRLRQMNKECAILVGSQYSNGKIISEYLVLGVNDIITMPVSLDLLLNKIAAMVCGHSGNTQ